MGNKIKSSFLAGLATIVPLTLIVYVLQALFKAIIGLGDKASEPIKEMVNITFLGFQLSSLIGLIFVIISLITISSSFKFVF